MEISKKGKVSLNYILYTTIDDLVNELVMLPPKEFQELVKKIDEIKEMGKEK